MKDLEVSERILRTDVSLSKEDLVDEMVSQTQGRWSEIPICGQTIP